MRSSVILFAGDLEDAGYERVLDQIGELARVDAVTLACNYHHSRDVLPHNPKRKVRFMRGGVFFRADPKRYRDLRIQPDLAPVTRDHDPLARLIEAAGRRGLEVRAWTNGMHSTALGQAHPDCAVQNVFGDVLITSLCPANPDVRAYVRALAGDLARYGLTAHLAESVCFMPFDHGYHHERTLVPISDTVKFLLGLCFCAHCRDAAERLGVAAGTLHRFLTREIDRALNGEACAIDDVPLEMTAVGALGGGEMQGFLDARAGTVASLVGELAQASEAVPLHVMEWSGGLRAVGGGMPATGNGGSACDRAWQDGVDIARAASACRGMSVLGYVPESALLERDLAGYRALLPPGTPLSLALRPMPPDCFGPAELAAKLDVAQRADVAWVDYYNYAFMRLGNLGWIGAAGERTHRS